MSETSTLMRKLQRAALLPEGAGFTDGQLLDRFLSQQDETAFEVLVRRHGPMVLAVCKRVGCKLQDAEDAFQACFLVLARKAASVRPQEAVGNWLHGVAYRTARRARAVSARRYSREKQVTDMPQRITEPEEASHELEAVLDREISHLPDKYRLPLVLCELEGRTRKHVARQLKLPEGTLSSRLATARKLLASRLTRRGITLGSGTLGAVLAPTSASANLPASLAFSTARAACQFGSGQATTALVSVRAAGLAEGIVKIMLLAKLKLGAALLIVVAAALGQGYSSVSTPLQAEPLQEKKKLPDKQHEPDAQPKSAAVTRPTLPVRKPDAVTRPTVPVGKPDVPAQPTIPQRKPDEQKPKPNLGRIRGRFTSVLTGKPVAGATLQLLIGGVPAESAVVSAKSDADGKYSLDVPLGHAELWGVTAPAGFYAQDAKTRGPVVFTVNKPELVRDFVLGPGSHWRVELQGITIPATKFPVFSAVPDRAGGKSKSAEYVSAPPDALGKAVLSIPTEGGLYKFQCGLQPFLNTFSVNDAKLNIEPGFDPLQVKGPPQPVPGQNAVRLQDAWGRQAVVEGAEVTLQGGKAEILFRAQSIKDTPPLLLHGAAVDENGGPVTGAKVIAAVSHETRDMKATFGASLETTTDASGIFQFRDLQFEKRDFIPECGINFVVIKAGRHGAVTKELKLLDIKKTGIGDFGKVVLKPGHTLRGRVIDGNGNPWQGALVMNNTNVFLYGHLHCRADAVGNFIMPDLSYGMQNLSVQFGDRTVGEEFWFDAKNDYCIITVKPAQ